MTQPTGWVTVDWDVVHLTYIPSNILLAIGHMHTAGSQSSRAEIYNYF